MTAPEQEPVPPALRAQILASEQAALVASRSMMQSEVLVRIGMFLTLVSATLVSLALVGQATGFDDTFRTAAVALLALVLVVGMLAQVRVFNTATEDLLLVMAMNRIRAAFVEIAPEVGPSFAASVHDDLDGAGRTYYFLAPRSDAGQVLGSSMLFMAAVNGILAALLAAAVALLAGVVLAGALAIGGGILVVFVLVSLQIGLLTYRRVQREWRPVNPSIR